MAKTRPLVKKARSSPKKTRKVARRRPAAAPENPKRGRKGSLARTATPALAAVKGATRRDVGDVVIESGRAGAARVKRVVYPPGFHWAVDMKPAVGTDLCMHAHVGFLERGEIHIEYADGCVVEFKAPQVVAIDPGHDGWVVGRKPAVLIEFDCERDTISRLGLPTAHRHA
jgi:hypothetical protein